MSHFEDAGGEQPEAAPEEVSPSGQKSRLHTSRSKGRKSAKGRKSSHKGSRKRRHHRTRAMGHSEADFLEHEATLHTPSVKVGLSTAVKEAPTAENKLPSQERPSSSRPELVPRKSSLGHVIEKEDKQQIIRGNNREPAESRPEVALGMSSIGDKAERSEGKQQIGHVNESEPAASRLEVAPDKSSRDHKAERTEDKQQIANGNTCEPAGNVPSGTGFFPSRHFASPKFPSSASPYYDFRVEPSLEAAVQGQEQTNDNGTQRDVQVTEVTSPASSPAPSTADRIQSQLKGRLMDAGSPDETLVSRARSFLAFWRLRQPESVSPESGCCESSPRYRLSRSIPNSYSFDSRLTKSSRTNLFLALLVPWVLVAVLALLLVRSQARTHHFRTALWMDQLGNACVTADCFNAVWELKSSIDLSVEPCKNFYGFVCGRWGNESSTSVHGRGRRQSSYMSIQRGAYVTAVNLSLLKPPRGTPKAWRNIASSISAVYSSCLRFFSEEPLNLGEVMHASGIDFNAWTSVSTFDNLFLLAIGHALQYNMKSVITVRWQKDQVGSEVLDISTGTTIAQRVGSSSRRYLVIRAFLFIGSYDAASQIEAVENLDNAINTRMSALCSSKTKKTKISLTDMDKPWANWSRAVGEYAELIGRQPPSEAMVENISDIGGVLEELVNADTLTAAVYLMLSPLAEFFLFEDEVQRQEPMNVDAAESVAKYETCVRVLEVLFGEYYRRWVSLNIYREGTLNNLSRIWKQLLAAAKRFAQDHFDSHLNWKHVEIVPELEMALPDTKRPTWNEWTQSPALPSEYSRDFISNLILFSRKTGAKKRCEPFLSLRSVIMKWSDPETLLRLLLPDFYHPQAQEQAINYATLGYFLAELLAVRSGLAKNWSSTSYSLCTQEYARSHLGLVLTKHHWLQMSQRVWAAHVALLAALMEDADFSRGGILLRLFFLRLGHTCCALAKRGHDDASDTSEVETSCNMVVMTAPNFSRAFGCHNLPEVGCS